MVKELEKNIKVIAEAILEKEKYGQLSPDTIKELENIIKG